eukprot:1159197-Pelagomonas_calceolata.AAC.10
MNGFEAENSLQIHALIMGSPFLQRTRALLVLEKGSFRGCKTVTKLREEEKMSYQRCKCCTNPKERAIIQTFQQMTKSPSSA